MNMDDAIKLLVGDVGIRMVRKDQIDREAGKEPLTTEQYRAIDVYVRHLVTTGRKDHESLPVGLRKVLNYTRRSQIRIRLASAFIENEKKLRSVSLPVSRQDWFLELLSEKYREREAESSAGTRR